MRHATGRKDTSEAPLNDERALNHAARMYALVAALSEALTPEEVAQAVLAEGIPALRAAAGLVSLIEPDGKHLSLTGAHGYSPSAVLPWKRMPAFGRLPLHDAIRTREPVWILSREQLHEQYPPTVLST